MYSLLRIPALAQLLQVTLCPGSFRLNAGSAYVNAILRRGLVTGRSVLCERLTLTLVRILAV